MNGQPQCKNTFTVGHLLLKISDKNKQIVLNLLAPQTTTKCSNQSEDRSGHSPSALFCLENAGFAQNRLVVGSSKTYSEGCADMQDRVILQNQMSQLLKLMLQLTLCMKCLIARL